jgi:probable rRNA maturation factor
MILNRQKKQKVDTRRAGRVLNRLLKHFQCGDREVTVVYLDDEGIREFNRKYLKKDRPTNVLSFSIGEGDFGNINPEILGDILISAERAAKEASLTRLSVEDMLDYLMIHGLLHLFGYDHERSRESADEMKRKEEELFSLLHDYPIHSMLDQ